jgi:hypothetical protein
MSKTLNKSRTNKTKSKKVTEDFAQCIFCDWQFITKSQRPGMVTRMLCHHLEREHKFTKEQVRIFMKYQAKEGEDLAHQINYGHHNNINFMFENGNRRK